MCAFSPAPAPRPRILDTTGKKGNIGHGERNGVLGCDVVVLTRSFSFSLSFMALPSSPENGAERGTRSPILSGNGAVILLLWPREKVNWQRYRPGTSPRYSSTRVPRAFSRVFGRKKFLGRGPASYRSREFMNIVQI